MTDAAYDAIAWFYNRYWGEAYHPQAMAILDRILLDRLSPPARILDLCCGTGHLTRILSDRGYGMIGMDRSREMLRYARKNAPRAGFILADARVFALRPSFPAVISTFESMNHVLNREELEQVFRNVWTALSDGGSFVFDLILEEAYLTQWSKSSARVEEDSVYVLRGGVRSLLADGMDRYHRFSPAGGLAAQRRTPFPALPSSRGNSDPPPAGGVRSGGVLLRRRPAHDRESGPRTDLFPGPEGGAIPGGKKSMIVYRKQEQEVSPRERLKNLGELMERLKGNPAHDLAVELLIEFGELEAALADSANPRKDGDEPLLRAWRQTALLTGHIFCRSWDGDGEGLRRWLYRLKSALEQLSSHPLPERVRLRVPEGYAHYGLFPETYLEAARKFFAEARPREVACIGLRSIGTSLSAVVGAALQEKGCAVRALTVRPRGHPFRRRLLLSSFLERDLRGLAGWHFLIVDEGPGLSGSSICCAAQKLSELGLEDERIVFFPSWVPDGTKFFSADARRRWSRHRKYSVSFEALWVRSGRLAVGLPFARLQDISAGAWRALSYEREADYPALHPNHERRKYLGTGSGRGGPEAFLIKFAGLGRYGRMKLERAGRLAASGHTPPVVGLHHGFLVTQYLPGRPLSRPEVDRDLLDRLARYLDFLQRTFPARPEMPLPEMLRMARRNTWVGLGDSWVDKLRGLEKIIGHPGEPRGAAVDGRMLPHEWIVTRGGFVKTDAIDHHANQFLPGCQDIAWDIAGTCVEFDLDGGQKDYLVESYIRRAGDRDLKRRFPLFPLLYLAYRLGYTVFASKELEDSPDGDRFRSLSAFYASRLREEIERLSSPGR